MEDGLGNAGLVYSLIVSDIILKSKCIMFLRKLIYYRNKMSQVIEALYLITAQTFCANNSELVLI